MRAAFTSFVGRCAALILASGCAHALSSSESPIKFIGDFSNIRYTPEHAYGYSVQLWRSGTGEVIGLLSDSDGLAADTPTGQLADVHFNEKNGSLSFTAKLSIASVYLGSGKTEPTHDVFTFSGTLHSGELLTGSLSHKNMLNPERPATIERIRLAKIKASPPIDATTLNEWRQSANRILKFRGPKW